MCPLLRLSRHNNIKASSGIHSTTLSRRVQNFIHRRYYISRERIIEIKMNISFLCRLQLLIVTFREWLLQRYFFMLRNKRDRYVSIFCDRTFYILNILGNDNNSNNANQYNCVRLVRFLVGIWWDWKKKKKKRMHIYTRDARVRSV